MKPVNIIVGRAVALLKPNIDTDQIVPKQFLRAISREGMAEALFHDWRFEEGGKENSAFILNWPSYRTARILITGTNFGCGSSREHAVWALQDFGIAAVIAPSFAEIFWANAINNGLLPVTLAEQHVVELANEADGIRDFRVDLPNQKVISPGGSEFEFELDEGAKFRLMSGVDAIEETLLHTREICAFETARGQITPWLP